MTRKTILAGTAIAAAWLLPGTTWAQFVLEEAPEKEEPKPIYTSEIEGGTNWTSESSFKFGEYTGLEDEGVRGVGNVTVRRRAPYDSDSTEHWEVLGTNLGLESRSVRLTYGRQGQYEAFFDFDQIPRFQTEEGRTPFNGVGSQSLTLPAGWVAAGDTSGLTQLRPSLSGLEIETRRDRFGGGITWHPFKDWKVEASFRREEKDGLDTIGATFATNGGNTLGAILPEPIDYETDNVDLSVAYTTQKAQLQFGYTFSNFGNEDASLTFQNPFSGPTAIAAFPNGRGQFALPPDNHAHYFNLTGGYNWGQTNRITANVSYSQYNQDEAFLPFSANPLVTITTPLPRNSLDGEINNTLINLNYSSRPLKDVDVRASYRFDNRDNDTSRDVFIRVVGDAEDQQGIDTARARINLPYSFEHHQAKLESGYRFLPRTKLSLGYQYDQKERDFQEVAITRDHTVRGRLSATPLSWASGWVQYARSMRDGSTYVDNRPFILSHSQEFLATGPELFENDPRLRKFWLADRDRDAFRGVLTFMPHSKVSVGLDGSYSRDDFDESPLGMQDRTMATATLDVGYSPRSDFSGHVFFTYENLRTEQKGCQFNIFDRTCIDNPSDTSRNWFVDNEDRIYSTGVGAQWNIIKDTLDLSVDYIFSLAFTSIDVAAGSALTVAPLPDIESRLHGVNLNLDYKLRDNLSARLGYRFETLSTQDFALDGIDVDTVSEIITLGETSPDYVAHVVGLSLAYRF